MGEPQVPATFERSGCPSHSNQLPATASPAQQKGILDFQPTPPQSGRGRLWGNRRFLPHWSEADVPPQAADFQRKSVPPNKKSTLLGAFCLVGEDGFEPSKSVTTDLQSAPFGRSGILPYINPTEAGSFCGAGGRLRTPDLLITNQLLYLLSYTSLVSTNAILS